MKDERKDALRDLGGFLDAARPYLDQVVLVGGWVPYFYRFLPEHRVAGHEPILTHDFDVATPARLTSAKAGTLDELLRKGEFVVIDSMEPTVLRYQHRRWGDKELAPIHFEFLTELTGKATGPGGASKATLEIQPGLQAQRLRHLELLRHEPLQVDSKRVRGIRLDPPVALRVPNPATYVIQKGLIHGLRRPDKVAKDFVYVHDVAVLWSGREAKVRAMVESLEGAYPLWKRRVREGRTVLARAFADEDAEGPVSVEKEIRDAGATPAVSARSAFRVVRPFLETALGVEAP